MSPTIYLIKTHKINLSNLFLLLLLENLKDFSFNACEYTLQNKFIVLEKLGNFAQSVIPDPKNNLRFANWKDYLDLLNQQVSIAQAQNKKIIFGSHHDDQIDFLKNHYKDEITTIGINYTDNLYFKLLQNVAEFHLFQLKNQQIAINNYDRHLLNTKSDLELVEYYSIEFDKLNLIPITYQSQFDYNISIDDFYNFDSIKKHFGNLNISTVDNSYYLWKKWNNVQFA